MERRRRRVYVPEGDRPDPGAAHAHHRSGRLLADEARGDDAGAADGGEVQALGRYYGARAWRCSRRRRGGRGAGQADRSMATTTTRPAAAGHRARLTGGLATAIAEKGYGAATIADVVRVARVSKRTFYEHFADKEACFLALYAETTEELLELISNAAATGAARGRSGSGGGARLLRARRRRARADARGGAGDPRGRAARAGAAPGGPAPLRRAAAGVLARRRGRGGRHLRPSPPRSRRPWSAGWTS